MNVAILHILGKPLNTIGSQKWVSLQRAKLDQWFLHHWFCIKNTQILIGELSNIVTFI